jgi:hypothetical protein
VKTSALVPAAPRKLRGALIFAACIASGLVAGVASSVYVSGRLARRTSAEQSAELDRRLAEARSGMQPVVYKTVVNQPAPAVAAGGDPAAGTGRVGSPAPKPKRTVEEIKASRANRMTELRAYDDNLIRQHWAEPDDKAWSSITTPSLRASMESLAKASTFKVVDVNCRSTSCLATFEWPSYDDASREFSKIADEPTQMNCTRGITLPEVTDQSQPVQATMIFGCKSWKDQGSQLAVLDTPARGAP